MSNREEVVIGFNCPNETQASRVWRKGARVGIVGGLGEMGRLFAKFFRDSGYCVEISDIDTSLTNAELVDSSDIVLFAVPLHQTVAIIRDLVPRTRPEQLLIDVTSLKVAPVREMLESRASVVGLHPMFGGRVAQLVGQTLVACPVRVEAADWSGLSRLFSGAGMRIKVTTPEEHDRMMSIIQVLFHMTTMLTGRVLRDLGVDISETLEYTSPSYRLEINLLGRMFAQNGALYSAITQMNPYTKDILAQLKTGLECYSSWFEAADLNSFVQDFERSAKHLGEFCPKAFEESSAMLDFAVRLGRKNDGHEEAERTPP
jgi:prephenate dehydrogenase